MDEHLVPAASNSKIRCPLENFRLDAEHWLAALTRAGGQVTATMQPTVRQNAGCKYLKNHSEDQVTFQN